MPKRTWASNWSLRLFATIFMTHITVLAVQSFRYKSEIESECAKYDGIVEGNRCYFIPPNSAKTDRDGAWASCDNYGAKLAQLLTISEENISRVLTSNYQSRYNITIRNLMVALHDMEQSEPPAVITNTTYWFDSIDYHHPNMLADNTRARSFSDSSRAAAPRCFMNVHLDDRCTWVFWYPLCQITGTAQNYTIKYNVCLSETPIEACTVATPEDCANICAKQVWCRSFQFILDQSTQCTNHQCQLFAWSSRDVCQNSKCPTRTRNANCLYYVYDP